MAEKESRRVKTLSSFIEWAAQFNDGQYLFRGVPNDAYEIQASAYRRLPTDKRSDPTMLLKVNKDLIKDARFQGHGQKSGQRLSDLELLAELQHFRAATCLIDFTRSALVALWFACQPNSTEKEANGKVFAVEHGDIVYLKPVTSDLIEKDIDCFLTSSENNGYQLYQWEPRRQNNRIIAQHSVFVFGGAQIEADAECVILKNSKQDLLTFLTQLSNITETILFPDFDGFVRLHAHDKPYIEADVQDDLQRALDLLLGQNVDAAIKYHDAAIEISPYNTEAHIGRGLLYRFKGDDAHAIGDDACAIEYYNRAIKEFDIVIHLNPDYAMAYTHRGVAYCRKGDFVRAIVDSNRAIQLDPDNPQAYDNLDTVWLHLREWEEAKSDLTTVKNMGVDIIALFYLSYSSVEDFEQRNEFELPADIAALLVPQQ